VARRRAGSRAQPHPRGPGPAALPGPDAQAVSGDSAAMDPTRKPVVDREERRPTPHGTSPAAPGRCGGHPEVRARYGTTHARPPRASGGVRCLRSGRRRVAHVPSPGTRAAGPCPSCRCCVWRKPCRLHLVVRSGSPKRGADPHACRGPGTGSGAEASIVSGAPLDGEPGEQRRAASPRRPARPRSRRPAGDALPSGWIRPARFRAALVGAGRVDARGRGQRARGCRVRRDATGGHCLQRWEVRLQGSALRRGRGPRCRVASGS